MSVVPLTLAGMTTLEPRDTGVAETPADLAGPADSAALNKQIASAGAGAHEGVLGRDHRALSIGIVSVVLLIAFEATAVGTAMPVAARELDGVALYAFAFSGYFTTESVRRWCCPGSGRDRRGPAGAADGRDRRRSRPGCCCRGRPG